MNLLVCALDDPVILDMSCVSVQPLNNILYRNKRQNKLNSPRSEVGIIRIRCQTIQMNLDSQGDRISAKSLESSITQPAYQRMVLEDNMSRNDPKDQCFGSSNCASSIVTQRASCVSQLSRGPNSSGTVPRKALARSSCSTISPA